MNTKTLFALKTHAGPGKPGALACLRVPGGEE
jgi:hypothetical protein